MIYWCYKVNAGNITNDLQPSGKSVVAKYRPILCLSKY